jgi:LysR family nitrogen assimilation transcriptional regulator
MELDHLRTFVAVAEQGTVSKAAQRLRVAQPALSRRISALEASLGLALFDRVRRRLVLTGPGEQLLADCRSILGAVESLGERARLLRREDAGVLKVGATPQMIDGVFATFLHRYAKLYPAVQINVTEAVGPDLLARLERGDLNLGIGSPQAIQTQDHPFGCFPLPAMEFLAACHTSLVLGNAADLEISRLARHPLLLLDPSFVVRTTVDAACRLAGFRPNVATESRSPHTLLSLAEAGHGVAVVPSVLPTHRYRLRIFRLTHRRRPLRMTMAVLWDKRRLLPRYADDFCKSLAAYLRDVLPISRPSPLGRVVKSDVPQQGRTSPSVPPLPRRRSRPLIGQAASSGSSMGA